MEYYRIEQKENIRNTIWPKYPSPSEIWGKDDPFFLPGTAAMPVEKLAFLPFYESNVFLISDPLKNIWESYQKGGRFRPCAFGSVEQRRVLPYCFTMPRIIEAVHSDTEYHKTGEVKELCLDRGQVGANRVFGIKTLRRMILIISGDVLEEMMRQKIIGYHWKIISVR